MTPYRKYESLQKKKKTNYKQMDSSLLACLLSSNDRLHKNPQLESKPALESHIGFIFLVYTCSVYGFFYKLHHFKGLEMNTLRSVIVATSVVACGFSISFGADFSKLSDEALVKKVASLSAQDEPEFVMEVHKRLKAKDEPQAKALRESIHQARKAAHDKLSKEQRQSRAVEVCKAMQKKTDSMSGKEIREAGLKVHSDCEKLKEPKRKEPKCHDHKDKPSDKPSNKPKKDK